MGNPLRGLRFSRVQYPEGLGWDWLSWRDLRSSTSHAPWWLVGSFASFRSASGKDWLRFVRSVGLCPVPLSAPSMHEHTMHATLTTVLVQTSNFSRGFGRDLISLGRFGAREQVVYTLVKECVNPGSIIPCLVVKWHLCLDEEENTRRTLPLVPPFLGYDSFRSVERGGPGRGGEDPADRYSRGRRVAKVGL